MDALRLSTCLACLLLTTCARGEENTLTESEKRGGWELLFDGHSTKGWRNYKQPTISEGWKVEAGALVRAGDKAGDIVTQRQFSNFELMIDYKISPAGNSGIMFHVTENARGAPYSGPEIQVQDNEHGHDPQKSGWLYELYQPAVNRATGKIDDATRPAGEWNTIQLRVTEEGCEINLNGYRYAQFKLGSDDWKQRVAASKFANAEGFGTAGKGHICLQDHGDVVAYRNIKLRELPPDGTAPNPVDGTLPVKVEPAYPHLQWADWEPVDSRGRPRALRPVLLTHPGDGSNRVLVAEQWGLVYAFENRPDVTESRIFLDVRDRVMYKDNENEEGLLGFACHPKFKENGEVFLYYTTQAAPHTSVLSRFKAAGDDHARIDPASEEELMRIPQPFWNHNGGTICFGPDGYLYVGLGDGGAGNDPLGNGQNLETLLGSILRIDVDHKDAGKAYAVPADNPFVGRDGAQPEIYAYGFRNVWRMAFDRQTGTFWCADVGQNLWEEIDLIVKGGNYGWGLREGLHPFGTGSVEPRVELIEPVWEYDHQVGKSITGGLVYRGDKAPALAGKYLYADYISGKIWALQYDEATRQVVSNEEIPVDQALPIVSFGEDEQGEVYFTVVTPTGHGIYKFVQQ